MKSLHDIYNDIIYSYKHNAYKKHDIIYDPLSIFDDSFNFKDEDHMITECFKYIIYKWSIDNNTSMPLFKYILIPIEIDINLIHIEKFEMIKFVSPYTILNSLTNTPIML